MRKVLIADESSLLVNRLASVLSNKYEIKSCTTVEEILYTLGSYLPDILAIDTAFMNRDIIDLLNDLTANGHCPRIVTLTYLTSQDVLNSLTCNTVDLIVSKPCNLDFVVKSISDIGFRIENPDHSTPATQLEIDDILIDLGFSMAHKSYRLLTNVILLRYDQPDCAMKELYIDVSRICQTSPENVEKGIRDAINRAYKKGDPEAWCRYFGNINNADKPFKGNSGFIAKIVEYIKMQKHN